MLCHVLAALVGMRFGWPGLKSSADACMRQECATCNRERERERGGNATCLSGCEVYRGRVSIQEGVVCRSTASIK